jgi:hypothetical protein
MSKRTATKPAAKRWRKRGHAVSNEWSTYEALDMALGMPEEFILEEMAIWSWSDTPHGDLWCDMSVTLEDVLKDVGLDAKERQFVWPDAGRFDLDKSVRRIPCSPHRPNILWINDTEIISDRIAEFGRCGALFRAGN